MPAATGELEVRRPAVDAARASAAVQALVADAKRRLPARPAAGAPPAVIDVKSWQAMRDKEAAARLASRLDALRPAVPPAVAQQIEQRVAMRMQGRTFEEALAAHPVARIADLAAKSAALVQNDNTPPPRTAAPGAAATHPTLDSIDADEGEPGVPLTLTGQHFGTQPGEIHMSGVGWQDRPADFLLSVLYWSDSLVVVELPAAKQSSFPGDLYLKRWDGLTTNWKHFHYIPAYVYGSLRAPSAHPHADPQYGGALPDSALAYSNDDWYMGQASEVEIHHSTLSFPWGAKGDDELSRADTLRNGWIVDGAAVYRPVSTAAPHGVALIDYRYGTSSKYVKVHWWIDAWSAIDYTVTLYIKRPKDLPCEAGCPP